MLSKIQLEGSPVMRLRIIQHVFSSFIHRIYICPTWVNITWEKCYFQKGVFFLMHLLQRNTGTGAG